MLLATFNDFFNTDKESKKSIGENLESRELKDSILENVKKIIEENKKTNKNKDKDK